MIILIAEDEKLPADAVRLIPESKGFTVDAVYDGITGRAYVRPGSIKCRAVNSEDKVLYFFHFPDIIDSV